MDNSRTEDHVNGLGSQSINTLLDKNITPIGAPGELTSFVHADTTD